jgi:hypothetical protein
MKQAAMLCEETICEGRFRTEGAIVLLELIPVHDEIYGDEACADYLWDLFEGFHD